MIIFRKSKKKLIIPVGINPNINYSSSGEVTSQSKTVDSSTSGQTVIPDEGYDYLDSVQVNPYSLEGSVVVTPSEQTITVTPSEGYDGFSSVTVEGLDIQQATVNSSTNEQVITPDPSSYFDSVTVHPYVLQEKSVESSTFVQTIVPDSGYDGLSSVDIQSYTLQDKTADPSVNSQTVNPDEGYDGMRSVTVNPVTSSIDSNIQASNIKSGVTILGVEGEVNEANLDILHVDSSTNPQQMFPASPYNGYEYAVIEPYTLQSKTVDSSTVSQTVTPDGLADGLSSVTVNPYTLQEKYATAETSSQTIVPDAGYDGLSSVEIDPYIPSLELVTLTVTGNGTQTIAPDPAYDGIGGVDLTVNVQPRLQSKSVSPIRDTQTVTPDEGYDGLSEVEVGAVVLQSKVVDSSTVGQLVEYDGLNDGLSDVWVNPYTLDSSSAVIGQNGTYTFTSSADGLSRVDISVNIPSPEPVLQSKTVDSSTVQQVVVPDSGYDGLSDVTIEGYVPSLDTKTVTITQNGSSVVTSDPGYDGLSSVEINVNVSGGTPVLQNKTVDSSTVLQTVTADSGYDGLGTVTVNPYTSTAVPARPNDVEFVGFDGTILYSYTRDEFLALTELPALVDDDPAGHIEPIGWSHELSVVQSAVESQCNFFTIGQLYRTKSGAVELWLRIDEHYCRTYARNNSLSSVPIVEDPSTGITISPIVSDFDSIDWGDGSTSSVSATHTYRALGDYCVKIYLSSSSTLTITSSSASLFDDTWKLDCIKRADICAYPSTYPGIEIGPQTFRYAKYLETITLRPDLTGSASTKSLYFTYCTSLRAVIIPYDIFGYHVMFTITTWQYMTSLSKLVLPHTYVTTSANTALSYSGLDRLYLSQAAAATNFNYSSGIKKLAIRASATGPTSINNMQGLEELFCSYSWTHIPDFNASPALKDIWVRNTSTVVSTFSSTTTATKTYITVHVPQAMLASYLADSSWTTWINAGYGCVVGYDTSQPIG